MVPPSSTSPRAVLSAAQGWTLAITATLVMAVSYIDRQTLAAIAPTVRAALEINHAQYGWLTAAFSLAYLAFAPVSGAIIDRVGCRVGLVLAVLAWSVVSSLHALAGSFATLFALRIALGITEAPSFPGGAQAVRRALPPSRRSAGFGLLFTGSSIGAMIAAPLAIGLLQRGSWRVAFLGTAAVGLLWIPGWLWVSGRPAARAALAVADPTPAEGAGGPAEPWHRLLREPAVLRAVLLVVATAPIVSFNLNWVPQYLVSEQGVTQAGVARYVWLPMLTFDLAAVGFGALASRRERRWADDPPNGPPRYASHRDLVALAGALGAAIALVPLAAGPWSSVALAAASNAGGGALFSLLTSDMLARVPPSRVSMAGGMTAAAQSLAYVVVNPLIGASVDRTRSYTTSLLGLGGLLVPGLLLWLAWPVRTPRRA